MKKRILPLIFALIMCLAFVSGTTFAADYFPDFDQASIGYSGATDEENTRFNELIALVDSIDFGEKYSAKTIEKIDEYINGFQTDWLKAYARGQKARALIRYERYNEALDISSELAEKYLADRSWSNLCDVYCVMGDVYYMDLHDLGKAKEYYSAALGLEQVSGLSLNASIKQELKANLATIEQALKKDAVSLATVKNIKIAGDYKKGSVYGPKLSQKHLNELKTAVQAAIAQCIREGMSEEEKICALVNYLCDSTVYSVWNSTNKSYSAWGPLVYGEADCWGYTRAFKALCDAAGIGCYVVHADANALNPSHEWNIVSYGGQWYHIDLQLIDTDVVSGMLGYSSPDTRKITLNNSIKMSYDTNGFPQIASQSVTLRG